MAVKKGTRDELLDGVRDEFHLAAAAKNLRKLAVLIPTPAPIPATWRDAPTVSLVATADPRRRDYFKPDLFNGIGPLQKLGDAQANG